MSTTNSFILKNIFPAFSDFNTFITQYDVLYTQRETGLLERIYKLMMRKYKRSSILYNVVDDFLTDLANILEDTLTAFDNKMYLLEKTYTMSDEDYIQLGETINNASNNPNKTLSSKDEVLTWITQQNYLTTKNNKLTAFLEAYRQTYNKGIIEFLSKISSLFLPIFTPENYYYEED